MSTQNNPSEKAQHNSPVRHMIKAYQKYMGQTRAQSDGSIATIISYQDKNNIRVRNDHGDEFQTTVRHFEHGTAVNTEGMVLETGRMQRRIGQVCEDHLGNRYPSQQAMCRAYNIPLTTFRGRRAHGWDLEKSLTAAKQSTSHREG